MGRGEAPRFWLRALLGLLAGLGAAAGAAAYLGISQREVVESVRGVDPRPLLLAAAGALILLALQSLRWWLVMRPVLPLGLSQAYRALAVGFFFNTLLPARGGDLLRVQYLGRRTGVSRAKLLGTELVDFWSDKWGWMVSFPVLCLLGHPPSWLFHAAAIVSGVVLLAGAMLAAMGSGLWRTRADGRGRGPRWLANLRDGFAMNQWKRLLLVETLIAPLPWLWETLLIAVASHALGMHLTAIQAFSVLTAFNLAAAVPSPGNAGSFEAGGALALTAFGVPHGTALTFIFLYHLTQVLPTFGLGALVLVSEGEKLLGKKGILHLWTSPRGASLANPDPG